MHAPLAGCHSFRDRTIRYTALRRVVDVEWYCDCYRVHAVGDSLDCVWHRQSYWSKIMWHHILCAADDHKFTSTVGWLYFSSVSFSAVNGKSVFGRSLAPTCWNGRGWRRPEAFRYPTFPTVAAKPSRSRPLFDRHVFRVSSTKLSPPFRQSSRRASASLVPRSPVSGGHSKSAETAIVVP